MVKTLSLLTLLFLFQGCAWLVTPPSSDVPMVVRVHRTIALINQRRDSVAHLSLEAKGEKIEERLMNLFSEPGELIARDTTVKSGGTLKLHIESSCSYLISQACKYAVTRDKVSLSQVKNLLHGLSALDDANGVPGYFPRVVKSDNGQLKVIHPITKSNQLSLLLCAYITTWRLIPDSDVRQQISNRVTLIASHLLSHNLQLTGVSGNRIEYSNLKPNSFRLSRSRVLDTLVFLEVSKKLTASVTQKKVLQGWLVKAVEAGYHEKILDLQFRSFHIKVPSYSSDWLNMIRLFALNQTTDQPDYKQALKNLFAVKRNEDNPLFNAIYVLMNRPNKRRKELLGAAETMLKTFPLILDNREVINSKRADVDYKLFPDLVKNSVCDEAIRPLPIYARPLSSYEWKRNPFRLDGNFGKTGKVIFSGVDYLEAYWLWRLAGDKRNNLM